MNNSEINDIMTDDVILAKARLPIGVYGGNVEYGIVPTNKRPPAEICVSVYSKVFKVCYEAESGFQREKTYKFKNADSGTVRNGILASARENGYDLVEYERGLDNDGICCDFMKFRKVV